MFVPTFGGPKTGWNHDTGNAMGHVENIPHGAVHVDVGGLMGRFETAGQDAIFWLHHANIDRLWEVWRSQPGHVDPTDAQWLDETFDLGFGNAELSMAVSQVLDTSASPLQYVYDGVAAVVPAAGGGFALDEGPVPPEDIEPTLVGATEQEVPIGADRAEVTIGVEPAGGLGLDEEAPKHVYVVLQNVKATTTRDRTYAVHVGVPEGEDPAAHPELLAGRFSTFGVVGATKTGAGLTVSFDVTPIVQALGLAGQAPGDLRVTVTPIEDGPDDDAALGLDDASDLRIGQIGVFFG
jgi:tyrosinase